MTRMGYAPRHITGKHGAGGLKHVTTNRPIKNSEEWINTSPSKREPNIFQRFAKTVPQAIKHNFLVARNFVGDNFHRASKRMKAKY